MTYLPNANSYLHVHSFLPAFRINLPSSHLENSANIRVALGIYFSTSCYKIYGHPPYSKSTPIPNSTIESI